MKALTIILSLLLAVALPVAAGCGSLGEALVLPAEVESAYK